MGLENLPRLFRQVGLFNFLAFKTASKSKNLLAKPQIKRDLFATGFKTCRKLVDFSRTGFEKGVSLTRKLHLQTKISNT